MGTICDQQRANMGLYKCSNLPDLVKGFIWTPDDFFMPKATEQSVLAWQDAIFNPVNRIFYWPPFVKLDILNTEASYEDTPFAMLPSNDGQYRFRGYIYQNMQVHRNMQTHNGPGGRIIPITKKNKLWVSRDLDGDVIGAKLAMLNAEKFDLADGSKSTTSPVFLALEDPADLDLYGDLIDGGFLKSIVRIVDVVITKFSAAANLIVVDVKVYGDGTPVVGLLAADFIIYDADGSTAHAISSVTPHATILGRYSIVGVGFVTNGFITLRDAQQLTIDGYEHPEPLLYTI